MSRKLEVILLVKICAALSNIFIHWLIVFFTNHTSSPVVNNTEIKQVWKKILLRKVDRLRLRALPIFGYTMGQFAKMSKTTGLDLLMMILNNTLTVLMS